jgi:hypothetical protein
MGIGCHSAPLLDHDHFGRQPAELELAIATSGASLCPAMMRAIVAAMVVDATSRDAQP